ncbi:hypothetical protein NPIL_411721 [Nephila pilipes]|uniref:Uncharacterized protein n=1 Tax=Nephila pilipes TaxID=299642 RepID=A0A8X6IKD1_NEPPI|nr:hypothetical protein NPIL_411721 [Nephila pilipes]
MNLLHPTLRILSPPVLKDFGGILKCEKWDRRNFTLHSPQEEGHPGSPLCHREVNRGDFTSVALHYFGVVCAKVGKLFGDQPGRMPSRYRVFVQFGQMTTDGTGGLDVTS